MDIVQIGHHAGLAQFDHALRVKGRVGTLEIKPLSEFALTNIRKWASHLRPGSRIETSCSLEIIDPALGEALLPL